MSGKVNSTAALEASALSGLEKLLASAPYRQAIYQPRRALASQRLISDHRHRQQFKRYRTPGLSQLGLQAGLERAVPNVLSCVS